MNFYTSSVDNNNRAQIVKVQPDLNLLLEILPYKAKPLALITMIPQKHVSRMQVFLQSRSRFYTFSDLIRLKSIGNQLIIWYLMNLYDKKHYTFELVINLYNRF